MDICLFIKCCICCRTDVDLFVLLLLVLFLLFLVGASMTTICGGGVIIGNGNWGGISTKFSVVVVDVDVEEEEGGS